MTSEGVQPLRIMKGSSSKTGSSEIQRPLSEISPMGVRRNSPSFIVATGNKKQLLTSIDSSSIEASPHNTSPYMFWKSREHVGLQNLESENTRPVPASPTRRTSIENLKRASRVTNSSMYAREQDSELETDSSILSNRPFSSHAYSTWGAAIELQTTPSFRSHKRSESTSDVSTNYNSRHPRWQLPTISGQISPHKSSLSTSRSLGTSNLADESHQCCEDGSNPASRSNTPHALRKPKSVSFDEQPPQINEYEMETPDPSSVASGSREGSYESDLYENDEAFESTSFQRDDSFDESLEDVDKTPVVLPEDWRFMSPETANTGFTNAYDDPFDKSNTILSPSVRYRGTPERDIGVNRSCSVSSTGDHRPLPPLPGMIVQDRTMSSSGTGASPKSLPIVQSLPRPASTSKADIIGMQSSPMPLEERLHLLSIQNEEMAKKVEDAKKQASTETITAGQALEDSQLSVPIAAYRPPSRVSRESILRKAKGQRFDFDELAADDPLAVPSNVNCSNIDYANLDPDDPIPSRETSSNYGDGNCGNIIKQEDEVERTIDMYATSLHQERLSSVSSFDDTARESSVIRHDITFKDESELAAVGTVALHTEAEMNKSSTIEAVKETALSTDPQRPSLLSGLSVSSSRMSLPEFASFFAQDDFGFGLQTYLTPSPPPAQEGTNNPQRSYHSVALHEMPELRPSCPVEQPELQACIALDCRGDGAASPDSVIHCPTSQGSISADSPSVPDPIATIKASGSKLKTRVSATPSDIRQMAATRRNVSGERPPSIDEQPGELSLSDGGQFVSLESSYATSDDLPAPCARRQSLRKLDLGIGGFSDELGLGLTEEFDRLLEAKKKGYLMRQNTKIVIANNRQPSGESKASEEDAAPAIGTQSRPSSSCGTHCTSNSPRKQAIQTWTTEPWNGKMRRQSTRKTNIVPESPSCVGSAPPLPGTTSNVTSVLDVVAEDRTFEDWDESGERGRLFVKVVSIKDLDLPLPKNEQCHFQMTLDNGLHCVTTAWSELNKTAPIGQEFELVVFEDLEFQLTLQTRLERPRSAASSVQSTTPSVNVKKVSAFSRLFTSPKKKKEQEVRQLEQEARMALHRQQEQEAHHVANRQPSAWDLQHELVGNACEFARAYVALSNHEQECYGRPVTVDVPAWNEWAIDEHNGASTRSKMGGVQYKPPYRIAKIELQLLYVPRPRGAQDEDMPKSMSAAIRQLKEAEAVSSRTFEGHLSQQGGDCPYWRRRFFKLNGSKLTAYHDMTRQPRATISLTKAAKLIDDKSSLTKVDPGSPTKSKGRRKSAFAEDEEGYMFVEEGFRIRFANGEVIDFYADDREQKEAWMNVLSDAVGKENLAEKRTWTNTVLTRERGLGQAQPRLLQVEKDPSRPMSTTMLPDLNKIVSSSSALLPSCTTVGLKDKTPAPIEKSPRHETRQAGLAKQPAVNAKVSSATSRLAQPSNPDKPGGAATAPSSSAYSSSSPGKSAKGGTGRRQAVRSMIF